MNYTAAPGRGWTVKGWVGVVVVGWGSQMTSEKKRKERDLTVIVSGRATE